MNSMVDQKLDFIRLFPGDSVKKWGCVQAVTVEGILVLITHVDMGSWTNDDGYILNTVHFIPWGQLRFYKCDAFEAHTGKRSAA
ncbi:MAG: hypothetical protein CMA05_04515 [Euryarchaeota archaeon]|nr:hypothetical protein [Euryarchaeota archaeon]|tara:strand:- start:73 stop:324 length:252 start_codon:yes stop_codon:yes gene_type:complete